MVDKIFALFRKEWSRLTDAAILLASFALLSQILALVRDRTLAHLFGTGQTLDIYYAAFRIPDLLFALIASFVSAAVVIPLFVDRGKESAERAERFFGHVLVAFTIVMAAAAAITALLMPYLVLRFFPTFSGDAHNQLVLVARIMLVSPILLGISSIFGSIAQSKSKFFVYALSPLLYNVGIIIGATVLYPLMGIAGLAWGVLGGALLHLLINIPAIHSIRPRLAIKDFFTDIQSIALLSLPRTIGLSLGQVTFLVLVAWAALLTHGSVTVFNFAWNLQSVPLSIIGVSFSVAAFPTLTRFYAEKNMTAFLDHILGAARQIIFWSIPIIALLIVLRAQIVRVILGSGLFTWNDTRLTAAALALFAISLVAQGLILLFVRGYYAAGDTKTPLIANSLGACVTIGSAWVYLTAFGHAGVFHTLIERLLRVEAVPGTEVLALSLAYTTGSLVNGALLVFFFRRDFNVSGALMRTTLQSLSAAIVAGVVAYVALALVGAVFPLTTLINVFLQGFIAGCAGIFACALSLRALKSREYGEIRASFRRRFWRSPYVVSPGPEELS
ncbi:MAG: murein biosynthesis integral membrane protein MurJ [Minisyncoccota bacterium]